MVKMDWRKGGQPRDPSSYPMRPEGRVKTLLDLDHDTRVTLKAMIAQGRSAREIARRTGAPLYLVKALQSMPQPLSVQTRPKGTQKGEVWRTVGADCPWNTTPGKRQVWRNGVLISAT